MMITKEERADEAALDAKEATRKVAKIIEILERLRGLDITLLDDDTLEKMEELLYHWNELCIHEKSKRSILGDSDL